VPTDKVLYDVADSGVATITLNDPDTRNALSPELLGGLIAAFESARDASEVRCVVLASSHEKTFSSGANLAELALWNRRDGDAWTRRETDRQ
jgi:enoyl-CoA hydratase/carnithine racemase